MSDSKSTKQLCPSCLARFNAGVEGSMGFSGAVGIFCKHQLVARLALLHEGLVCDDRTVRSASDALARARFGRYLADLAIEHGSRAATVTYVAV